MIPEVLAFSLLLTQQLPGATQRNQFTSCLRSFMSSKLEERMTPANFQTALAGACREQEAAYRTAYVEAAVRAGDRRALAEQDANTEVQDLRSNYLELFRGAQPE
jgi:hypothetical protein